MIAPDADLSDRFVATFYGKRRGWACFGYKPSERPKGEQQETVIERWFQWHDGVDRAIEWIEDMAPQHALYWSPLLHREPKRRKGNAINRRWLWLDLDGPPANAEFLVDLQTVEVRSGRPGHYHHYVALSRSLTAGEYHRFARGLRAAVGGSADAKIADNDLMRLPGSLNFRTTPLTS